MRKEASKTIISIVIRLFKWLLVRELLELVVLWKHIMACWIKNWKKKLTVLKFSSSFIRKSKTQLHMSPATMKPLTYIKEIKNFSVWAAITNLKLIFHKFCIYGEILSRQKISRGTARFSKALHVSSIVFTEKEIWNLFYLVYLLWKVLTQKFYRGSKNILAEYWQQFIS